MLEARGLTRVFGDTTVLDDVSLTVTPGRITGFVGANGAGKTTTMRILMGVLAPTSGQVLWDGAPITAAVRRTFGYMPEERGLYPRMKLRDQLVFFARLHGFDATAARERADHLLDHFGLLERADDLLDDLSLGNQQRVQIAAALVHRPSALVLDEPFSGLDPVAVDSMTDLLRTEADGLPLLFSSHQLDLVERLCDDLVVLAGGRLVASGSVDELRSRGQERYRVTFQDGDAGRLREVRGLAVGDVDGASAVVTLDDLPPAELVAAAVGIGPVVEVSRVQQPLSEIFREVSA
ncbi:ATP-binding cassette domain-containing protein [Nocardioides sp. C4-1]|uniref:ABC transporter ATP-binding protein n=1 Tax=Nocardioides sp. C4-1 TaxID=3151851 RepID=UPI003263949B